VPVPPRVAVRTDVAAVAGSNAARASPSYIKDHASSTPASPGTGAASAATSTVSPTASRLGIDVMAASSTRTMSVL
jgi:hypothetical protein